MSQYLTIADIQVDKTLFQFIEQQVLPGLPLNSSNLWQGISAIVTELTPINKALLLKRDELQASIDKFHQQNKHYQLAEYKNFLHEIDYLQPEPANFAIETQNVDDEIARLAGPQLVVPIINARFALNAVNARWGSLYDALYGTDVISSDNGAEPGNQYNPARGEKVIAFAKQFLAQHLPLKTGNFQQVTQFNITEQDIYFKLDDGSQTTLADNSQFKGFSGEKSAPTSLLFVHNGLHIILKLDSNSAIAKQDSAGISDVILESALTTIMDCEDSVAAVDAEDKVLAYKNWLGLNQGNLTEQVTKNGQSFERRMQDDLTFTDISGKSFSLPGRSLMFVRNVGHLMQNDAMLDSKGEPVFEGIMDAIFTSLIALHDLNHYASWQNSRTGSIYIVKPKMHGPDEVAFTSQLFARVEQLLGLAQNTIKMGIMDEERRTTVNLKACIEQAKHRVVFINTGFLDRTGDEIHTSMHAGVMAKKGDIKHTSWISAYENNNVDVGLACGLSQKAQIGKGMWAMPDLMAAMLEQKIAHPQAGANTAWVPSPTAATLHAMHYHQVDVFATQQALMQRQQASLDDILTPPVVEKADWTEAEIEQELANNCQGILGYVVRWIDQGIGCSKVPDINNIGLMEDRATLRISSQHIANWLLHGVCSKAQVEKVLEKMAVVVDQQNANDKRYQAMAPNFEQSIAFQAAKALIFEGCQQPNGYTEPLLHKFRQLKKAQ